MICPSKSNAYPSLLDNHNLPLHSPGNSVGSIRTLILPHRPCIQPASAASVVTVVTLTTMLGRSDFDASATWLTKNGYCLSFSSFNHIGIFFLVRVHHIMDVIPFVLIYSTAYGGNGVVKAAIMGDYYGRKNFGTFSGPFRDSVHLAV